MLDKSSASVVVETETIDTEARDALSIEAAHISRSIVGSIDSVIMATNQAECLRAKSTWPPWRVTWPFMANDLVRFTKDTPVIDFSNDYTKFSVLNFNLDARVVITRRRGIKKTVKKDTLASVVYAYPSFFEFNERCSESSFGEISEEKTRLSELGHTYIESQCYRPSSFGHAVVQLYISDPMTVHGPNKSSTHYLLRPAFVFIPSATCIGPYKDYWTNKTWVKYPLLATDSGVRGNIIGSLDVIAANSQ